MKFFFTTRKLTLGRSIIFWRLFREIADEHNWIQTFFVFYVSLLTERICLSCDKLQNFLQLSVNSVCWHNQPFSLALVWCVDLLHRPASHSSQKVEDTEKLGKILLDFKLSSIFIRTQFVFSIQVSPSHQQRIKMRERRCTFACGIDLFACEKCAIHTAAKKSNHMLV